jgi:D-alanyl-lipoteichoic acid acyltransferase DltB (MBOAT superfamily)
MLFNSIEFLIFLPIVFTLYWAMAKHYHWQNLLVVVVSYLFYGWWDWRFLLLIAFTTLCSYLSGLMMQRHAASRTKRKIICAANITINLAILGIFKYYNFFADNFDALMTDLGLHADVPTLNLILPVGHLVLHLSGIELHHRRVSRKDSRGKGCRGVLRLRHVLSATRGWPHRTRKQPISPVSETQKLRL